MPAGEVPGCGRWASLSRVLLQELPGVETSHFSEDHTPQPEAAASDISDIQLRGYKTQPSLPQSDAPRGPPAPQLPVQPAEASLASAPQPSFSVCRCASLSRVYPGNTSHTPPSRKSVSRSPSQEVNLPRSNPAPPLTS